MTDSNQQALDTVVLSADRLRSLSLPAEEVEPVLDLAMLAALRERMGEARPPWVGFIGCTGSGKSTIFNSLCRREACITGWKAHNTSGPVMLSSTRFYQSLKKLERQFAPLFLPRWKRESNLLDQIRSEAGAPGSIHWILTDNPSWERIVLFDLPDINTTRALYENRLAMTLLPWLDVVVYIVDEETLYHRDYEEPVAQAKSLQQRRLCVLNNRGRDRIELDHPDLQGVREFFGVDTLHVLPDLGDKPIFDSEPEFLRFRDDLFTTNTRAPHRPIFDRLAPHAGKLVKENERRGRVFVELQKRAEQIARKRLANEPLIPMQRILNSEALQVLEHLGLKRFSVSNLLQFLKRIATKGALQSSFTLAFGSHREDAAAQLLHLDVDKLNHEASARLFDHREAISQALHSHADAELIGDIFASSAQEDPSFRQELAEVSRRFEENCRELIASDSISSSLKNDPLLAVGLLAAMIFDVFTVPGFGSWALIPSVFKFLPLGKFEKTKREFQQRIRDVIRESLMEDLHKIQSARRNVVMDSSDPLLSALRTFAGHDKN